MTDDRYLATLQGAEKYRQRRSYLLKKKELSETYEDKIFQIYSNPKLTHRQKMARIATIKKEATKKLHKAQAEEAGSIVGEIRAENLRRFRKKYDIKEVAIDKNGNPVRQEVIAIGETKFRLPPLSKPELREKAVFERVIMTTSDYKTLQKQGFPRETAISKVMESKGIKPAKGRKWFDVRNLTPDLKKRLPKVFRKDSDKDGVVDAKDCKPFDKKKQDLGAIALGVGASFVGSKLSRATERKKKAEKERTDPAGKRRYGVYWSGERVGSFETKQAAEAEISDRVAGGKGREDYEIVLESYQGEFIRILKN